MAGNSLKWNPKLSLSQRATHGPTCDVGPFVNPVDALDLDWGVLDVEDEQHGNNRVCCERWDVLHDACFIDLETSC